MAESGGCDSVRKKPKRGAPASAGAVEVASNDDLLREILVRLPDTASLARAALACKRWRLVASHPSLLRRFHSLHQPPPLLGFFMSKGPLCLFSWKSPNLFFLHVPSRNPHLRRAAAVAAGFHFEDLTAQHPRSGPVTDEWILRGYDGGLLLLSYGFIEHEELAVYDPIARTTGLLRRPDVTRFDFDFDAVQYALVAADDDAAFRVFGAQFFDGRVMGAVFDSRTADWTALPTLLAPYPWNMHGGMRAGRFAYWQSNSRFGNCNDAEHALVFDTVAMEWTLIQVPFPAKESYCVADMAEHGGLCLVSSKDQSVHIWARDNTTWVIKKTVSLLKQFVSLKKLRCDVKRVRILAARDGHIYMEFWSKREPNSYLLVLNWEALKLSVDANDTTEKYRGIAFPFFMTWAPPLLSPAQVQALGLQGV